LIYIFSGQRKVEADSGDHARGHDVAVVAGGLQDDDGGGQRNQTESHDKDGFSQSKFRYIIKAESHDKDGFSQSKFMYIRQKVTTIFNHHSIGNSDKKLQHKCISCINKVSGRKNLVRTKMDFLYQSLGKSK
jgi:hypothetical protein